MGKLGRESFDYYVSLGPARSYQAVGEKYGVTKRAVTIRAVKERWQERLRELEEKAQATAEERAAETMEAVNTRHLKTIRAIQAKAIQALKEMPMKSAIDAVRALDISIRQERMITGLMVDPKAIAAAREPPPERNGLKELPMWLSTICLRRGHLGDEASPGDVFVARLIEDVEGWLGDLAEGGFVDRRRSFTDILLEALENDPDEQRLADMKRRVLRLDEELEAYRDMRNGEDDPFGVAAARIRQP